MVEYSIESCFSNYEARRKWLAFLSNYLEPTDNGELERDFRSIYASPPEITEAIRNYEEANGIRVYIETRRNGEHTVIQINASDY